MRERKNLSLRFFQALCRPPASPSSSPRRVGVPPPPPPKSTLGGAGGGTARSPATPPGPRRWYQGELPGGPPLNPRGVPQPPGVGRSRANPPGPRRWHQGELPDRGSALPAGLRAARGGGGRGGGEALFYPFVVVFKKIFNCLIAPSSCGGGAEGAVRVFFFPAAVRDALPARDISTSVVWRGLGGGGDTENMSPCW